MKVNRLPGLKFRLSQSDSCAWLKYQVVQNVVETKETVPWPTSLHPPSASHRQVSNTFLFLVLPVVSLFISKWYVYTALSWSTTLVDIVYPLPSRVDKVLILVPHYLPCFQSFSYFGFSVTTQTEDKPLILVPPIVNDTSDYSFRKMMIKAESLSSTSLPTSASQILSILWPQSSFPCLVYRLILKTENQKTDFSLWLCKYRYQAKQWAMITFLLPGYNVISSVPLSTKCFKHQEQIGFFFIDVQLLKIWPLFSCVPIWTMTYVYVLFLHTSVHILYTSVWIWNLMLVWFSFLIVD